MQVKTLVIQSKATTGNQAYTGFGSGGKVLLLQGVHRGNGVANYNGDLNAGGLEFGCALSSSERFAIGFVSNDNAATSTANAWRTRSACFVQRNAANTVLISADFVSWDADGFTLNWTTAADQRSIIATVISGTDVSAAIGDSQCPAATGNQSVTGLAFQPNALLIADAFLSSSAAAKATSSFPRFQIGFCDSAGNSFAWCGSTNDGLATSDTMSCQSTSACSVGTATSSGALDRRATWVSYNSDGFTLNWTTLDAAVGVSSRYYYLALSVPMVKVGNTPQRTSTGTTQISGLGFQPRGMLFGGDQSTSTNGGSVNNRIFFGAASGTAAGDQAVVSSGDADGLADTDTSNTHTAGKAVRMIDEAHSSPTTLSQASVSATDSDSFTLNWDTVDATARLVGYMAFGSAEVPKSLTAETGTGTDALSAITAQLAAGAETGQGVDGLTVGIKSALDGETGVGVDDISVAQQLDVAGLDDTGSGSETLVIDAITSLSEGHLWIGRFVNAEPQYTISDEIISHEQIERGTNRPNIVMVDGEDDSWTEYDRADLLTREEPINAYLDLPELRTPGDVRQRAVEEVTEAQRASSPGGMVVWDPRYTRMDRCYWLDEHGSKYETRIEGLAVEFNQSLTPFQRATIDHGIMVLCPPEEEDTYLARDLFEREETEGIGNADTGGTWVTY